MPRYICLELRGSVCSFHVCLSSSKKLRSVNNPFRRKKRLKKTSIQLAQSILGLSRHTCAILRGSVHSFYRWLSTFQKSKSYIHKISLIKEFSNLIGQEHSGGMSTYACITLRETVCFLHWFLFISKKNQIQLTFHSGDLED